MSRFHREMAMEEFATLVCEGLRKCGIQAVLTGGGAVTVYSENRYVSSDADFISPSDDKDLEAAMKAMGFTRKGKDYVHSDTDLTVEFPGRSIEIGNESIAQWATRKNRAGSLSILRPTECVMDRLAWFYHCDDRQTLDQAVEVAHDQPVDLKRIETWSVGEKSIEKFRIFRARLEARNQK